MRALGEDDSGGIRAHVPRDARQEVRAGAGVDVHPEVARPHGHAAVDHERERLHSELGGIDAEHQMVHGRVADQGRLDDVLAVDSRLRRDGGGELPDRALHRGGERRRLALVLLKVGDAAHQVFAEPDLRVHHAAARDHLARFEVAQMPRDGSGADVDREPVHVLLEPGPHRNEVAAFVYRDGALPVAAVRFAGPHCGGQALEKAQVRAQAGELPFAFERLQHPGEVAGLVRHARAVQLDVEQLDHRVDFEVADLVGRLSHHLAVDLALGRHVDDDIAAHLRLAAQSPAFRETLDPVVLLLCGGGVAEVTLQRFDAELRELAGAERDLAAPADGASAAHRVDVHAEGAGRGEHRGAGRELAATPRGHEDDAGGCRALRLGGFAHDVGSGPGRLPGFSGTDRRCGVSMEGIGLEPMFPRKRIGVRSRRKVL